MKICYTPKRFRADALAIIETADAICDEYISDGLNLTLRQLYYQFVSRDIIPNNMKSYKRLQKIINEARLAGLISWEAIIDRTRNLETHSAWWQPSSIISSAAQSYRRYMWDKQEYGVQVWVEKDALMGVVERAAEQYRLPYFSCRGYVSQSELWKAAQNLEGPSPVIILHLGDHDPSGVDMTRDIQDRFNLFGADNVIVERIALTMKQINALKPPPNPAKLTDSRAEGYIKKFGQQSWELDALNPQYIVSLIEEHARKYIDFKQWNADLKKEDEERDGLSKISLHYDDVVKFVSEKE